MGDPQEWYKKNVNSRYRALSKYGLAYLQCLADDTATANGVFGANVKLGCLGRFGVIAQWPAVRKQFSPQMIWLRRRDKLRQAISRYRAKQTDEWSKPITAPLSYPPQFDAAEIWRNYDLLVAWDTGWERTFRRLAVCPREVWYEEILADPQAAVDAICRLVDVKAPRVDVGRCPLAVQRDEVTEMWARRLSA
jgi:LPS sulfotransferase NodH